ncbi:MAG: 5-formyltetrahydrofolate cyclo-ligase [Deltaproteobacteria bacterium]|nr:5-formyltetrahydrofolate cyclo-ligase [Deltaproteobacteria bacterium]MBI3389698.1 5-formyltetrahydrofolate cyclo-ligase [Deltaproteobacteria bacterium]
MTKDDLRRKVWMRLKLAEAIRFPAVEGRVPNFAGADHAALLLGELTLWKRAKALKISSDAPQRSIRHLAIVQGKIVYIPVPHLRGDKCFVEIDPERLGVRALRALSIKGALRFGRLVAPHEMQPVDLIVCGSMAVSRQGARLGSGGGYCDLEYALLRKDGKVREYTPILTTIHPLQIVEERIPMRGHDLPVDFLVTPEQVIAAPSLHPRPRGIMWDLLAEERIRAIPALQRGRREVRGAPTPRQI